MLQSYFSQKDASHISLNSAALGMCLVANILVADQAHAAMMYSCLLVLASDVAVKQHSHMLHKVLTRMSHQRVHTC